MYRVSCATRTGREAEGARAQHPPAPQEGRGGGSDVAGKSTGERGMKYAERRMANGVVESRVLSTECGRAASGQMGSVQEGMWYLISSHLMSGSFVVWHSLA